MCSGSEAGSYSRLTDSYITQVEDQGPFRTFNESQEEEEEDSRNLFDVPTQGPSWGYLKVNSQATLSIFGDKCP